MEAFEAKLSQPKMALLLLGSVAMCLSGMWLVGLLGPAPEPWSAAAAFKMTVGGWGSVVLFGSCAVLAGRRLSQPGVDVRVDSAGIYWRRWSETVIPWEAIERISTIASGRQQFVCLFLRDPADYPGHGVAGFSRRLAGSFGSNRFGDVSLSVAQTDRSHTDLLAAVERYAPAGMFTR